MPATLAHCGGPAAEQCQCIAALKQAVTVLRTARCQRSVLDTRTACHAALQAAEANKPQDSRIDRMFLQGKAYRDYLANVLGILGQTGTADQAQTESIDIKAWQNLAETLGSYRRDAEDENKFIVPTETSANELATKVKQAVVDLAKGIHKLVKSLDYPVYLQHVDITQPAKDTGGEPGSLTNSSTTSYLMTLCGDCDGWTERSIETENGTVNAVLANRSIVISASDCMRLDHSSYHRPLSSTSPLTFVQVNLKQRAPTGNKSDFSVRGLARRDDGNPFPLRSARKLEQTLRPGDRQSALLTAFAKSCDDASDSLTSAAKEHQQGSLESSQLFSRGTVLSLIADVCKRPSEETGESEEE